MFQGIFKSAINDANKNYIFGTGSIPINIKTAQLATFADGTTKQQGYQVDEVNKLISTMLTGWDKDGNKPKSMSDNFLELILSCDNGFVVKKRLQFPHIIAWKDDSTPYNIADVYKQFSIDNWLKADDFENPDITLVVEPTDEILTTSTATPPEATTEQSGRFYLYYRNLPVGINRVHIDFHIKTKTEPIDFDLEVIDGLLWKDAQVILSSNEQAKINVLLGTVKDVYKFTGAEGNFENITMHEWSALYQQIISLRPNNRFTHDLYFYVYDESELNTKITELEGKVSEISVEETENITEEVEVQNDDGGTIVKVGSYGIKAKAFLDLNDNPIGGGEKVNVRADRTIYFGADSPINTIGGTLGFASMFEDWGFIGDSLTSGYIAVDNIGGVSPLKNDGIGSIGRNIYRMSWGQILCRMCGTKGTNFSIGGATTVSWLSQFANGATNVGYNSDGTIGVNFLTQKKSAYTICLGTNDSGNNIPVGNVATDVDLNDYNNNANTFAGNYAKIIQMCKAMTPSCKMFLITPFSWWSMGAESKGYNAVVRQLATMFSKVYLIDLYNYGILSANDYEYQAHCNTQGYTYVSYVIASYIDFIVRDNPNDFKYHCLIPSLEDGMDDGTF